MHLMYKFIFRLITRLHANESSRAHPSFLCSLLVFCTWFAEHPLAQLLTPPSPTHRATMEKAASFLSSILGGDGKVHPRIPHQILQGHRRAPGHHHRHWYPWHSLPSLA
jgi:hypothetical protein